MRVIEQRDLGARWVHKPRVVLVAEVGRAAAAEGPEDVAVWADEEDGAEVAEGGEVVAFCCLS